jgi:hypothetical protein
MRATRAAFGTFLCLSAALLVLAIVALVVVAMSRGHEARGSGGGSIPVFTPTSGRMNDNIWYYFMMRDLIELTYWNDVARYQRVRAAQIDREHDVAQGVPVKSGLGHMGGHSDNENRDQNGNNRGDNDGDGSNVNHRAVNIQRARTPGAHDEDDDATDEDEDDFYDHKKELTFIQSIYAFVFGRGDPNESLELRRWRAVGALLRVNKGCVFAEQVAPFLDSYLLDKDDNAEIKYGLFGVVFDFVAHVRRLFRKKKDDERDASRMHEGYMLEVLTRFGGFPEATEDGRLVYIFPTLQVTTIDPNVAGPSRPAPGPALPSPIPPPIYERTRPLLEGGEKMPLVIFLGCVNILLIYVFRAAGGMDWKPVRRPIEPQVARTMSRRAGRFRDTEPIQSSRSDSDTIDHGEPPIVILILELFPKLCKLMMPLLVCYATIFFLVPSLRALYVYIENRRIKRRNERRKNAIQDALTACIEQTDKQRIAHGKQSLEVL